MHFNVLKIKMQYKYKYKNRGNIQDHYLTPEGRFLSANKCHYTVKTHASFKLTKT